MATENRKTAIEFYKANATNVMNIERDGSGGWDGIRGCSQAKFFAKDALVMSLADACDFAEAYAKATK